LFPSFGFQPLLFFFSGIQFHLLTAQNSGDDAADHDRKKKTEKRNDQKSIRRQFLETPQINDATGNSGKKAGGMCFPPDMGIIYGIGNADATYSIGTLPKCSVENGAKKAKSYIYIG